MRHHPLWLLLVLTGTWGLAAPQARGNDPPATSVQEFVEQRERWPRLVGAVLTLEGRYTVLVPGSLRFRNCDLDFRINPGIPLPRGNTLTVEVRGSLARDGDQLYFEVTQLRELPTDIERLRAMRGALDGTQPDEWYRLQEWARLRGEFYNDDALRAEAAILARNGMTAEYNRLRPEDGPGLRALAEKVRALGLSEHLRMEYVHESLWRDHAVALKETPPNYALVLGNVTRLLPGSGTPLPIEMRDDILKEYLADPLTYYREADEASRRRGHRAFYVALTRNMILAAAREDGSNGRQISQRILRELPEFPELADEYELKYLAHRQSLVGQMTRAEVGELSQSFRDRDDQDRASAVWREWLRSREELLRQDGPRGLMQLADDYEELVGDRRQAERLALEAALLAPQNQEIAGWLRDHGYVYIDNRWVHGSEVRDHPLTEVERNIRDGRVRAGMTREQVRGALGGDPTSIIRMASHRHVTELWIYEEHRLSVRFRHTLREEEPTVVGNPTPLAPRTTPPR